MKSLRLVFLLLIFSVCTCLPAQTFSLITGREPVASLDGLWRFHTGDDPTWASPDFDDSQWTLLRSDEDWAKQGYRGYGGMAWYRFRLTVPAGLDHVSLLLPPLLTNYRVFANGREVGSYGDMPAHAWAYRPSPAAYQLQLGRSVASQEVTVALRVWHWSGWSRYYGGGPVQGGAAAGESELIDARLQHLNGARLLSSGGSFSTGLLCAIAGLIAMLLFLVRRKETEFLWFSLNQLGQAAIFGVDTYAHFHVMTVLGYDNAENALRFIAGLSYTLFLRTLLQGRRSILFYLTIASFVLPFVLFITLCISPWLTIGFVDMTTAVCRVVFLVWVSALLARRAIEELPDARLVLVPVLIAAATDPVEWALNASFQLGWLRTHYQSFDLISHPFPVSVDQCAEILFLIAMLIILSNRFMRMRREEQRMMTELEAARTVQSLLLLAAQQNTPGFAVESVYLPASEVGGDFFQILPDVDGSMLIVVGDVSGKGLRAAMTVSAIVGALRGCTLRAPAEVLAYLNRVLLGQIEGFVTCCVTLISADGTITIANAGHLPPYSNGENLAVQSALPLGITAEAIYEETTCQLDANVQLTYISDGVVEARNSSGELYGFERTRTICRESAQAIAETARRFGQEDDITVLTVARVASSKAVLV